jgi:hypothetical protein
MQAANANRYIAKTAKLLLCRYLSKKPIENRPTSKEVIVPTKNKGLAML